MKEGKALYSQGLANYWPSIYQLKILLWFPSAKSLEISENVANHVKVKSKLCTCNSELALASYSADTKTVAMLLAGLCTSCNKIKKTENTFSTYNTGFVTILFTCTTGVPKFSGSVRGRWSRVWKE